MDRPESYIGPGHNYYTRSGRSRQMDESDRNHTSRPMQSYDDDRSESTDTAIEEHDQYGDPRYYTRENAIPIVQRESSLQRIQEVFSEHGMATSSGSVAAHSK